MDEEEIQDINDRIAELEDELAILKLQRDTVRTVRTVWYAHGDYNSSELLESMGVEPENYHGPSLKGAPGEVGVAVELDLQTGDYDVLHIEYENKIWVPKES